jgi:DNA-binding NarL/FixJ family response regulator
VRPQAVTKLVADVRAEYDASLAAARSALGVGDFAAAWAEGRAMPLEQAVADALEALAARPGPGPVDEGGAPAGPGRGRRKRLAWGLTEREAEVLRLVAAGKTDRQIAADLVLSERTVGRHLANVYNKLGVSSRAAATAFALRAGLA